MSGQIDNKKNEEEKADVLYVDVGCEIYGYNLEIVGVVAKIRIHSASERK